MFFLPEKIHCETYMRGLDNDFIGSLSGHLSEHPYVLHAMLRLIAVDKRHFLPAVGECSGGGDRQEGTDVPWERYWEETQVAAASQDLEESKKAFFGSVT